MGVIFDTRTWKKMMAYSSISILVILFQISQAAVSNLSNQNNDSTTMNTAPPISRHSQQSTEHVTRSQTETLPQISESGSNLITNLHSPVFKEESYYVEVQETSPVSTHILTAVAIDEDSGANGDVTYRIEGSDLIHNIFAINSVSGDIRLAQKFNNTWTAVYNFEVIATDGGMDPRHARVKVEVVIVVSNANRPIFEEDYYEAKVDEDASVGTSVLQVIATDEDEGPNGILIYSFVDDSNSDEAFTIHITTGVINTARNLDFNRHNKYTLVVQASDQGSPPLTTTTHIYVTVLQSTVQEKQAKQSILFVGGAALFITGGPKTTTEEVTTVTPTLGSTPVPPNRYHPYFTEDYYTWTIPEVADIGTLVAIVSADDEDNGVGGDVRYSIEPEDVTEFTIDTITGTIKVAAPLNGSRGSVFFSVVATDQHPDDPRSTSAEVEVVVAEINKHPPVFEKDHYEARVREDALRYSRVIKVTATDIDTGRNGRIDYTFQSGQNGGGTFAIDRSLGIIRILKVLDRELKSEYDLIVEASDSGIPKYKTQVSVRVVIRDVNDNAPKFSGYYLRMYIMENGPPFHLVGTIKATDADEGANAEVRYAMLLNSLDAYKFQLDFRTGDLHALDTLDREEQSEYRVTIRAASPPLFSQAIVIIYVLDENDNPPVPFNSTIYLNFYGDYIPKTKIGQLGATDPDATTELTYELQQETYSDLFLLNRTTGELYASQKLATRYVPKILTFTVDVSDGLFNTTAEIVIHVSRVSYDMLTNSLSLHLMTKKMRVDMFVKSKTFEVFLEAIADVLDTELDDVYVLGMFDEIHPYVQPAINLTFVALKRDGEYFTSAELRARIALEQARLWEIVAILPPVDKLCTYESCDTWPNCKGLPAYKGNYPTVISPTYSFMSLRWDRQYHCICPPGYSGRKCNRYYDFCNEDPCQRYGKCRTTEQGPYCQCEPGFVGDFCERDTRFSRCPEKNICQNNGTCIESQSAYIGGFYCDCPNRGVGIGSFCEGTTRTFVTEGSFLAFEELGWHDQLNIKLSFRTYRTDGLILYNARSNRRQHDFIALEVVNKQLVFSFSLGELYSKVYAGLYGGISNGEWHDVQINFVRQHVLVGIDSCIHWVETVQPDEYLQWNIGNQSCLGYATQFGGISNHSLTPEEMCEIDLDNITCLGYGSQFGGYYDWRFFDLDGPLFLGAAQNYWFGLAVENKNFVGCIRDVYIDYQQLDLNNYIKENSTKLGCDLRFNDPCSDGQCNLADDPIHIGPVKILRTRSWGKAIQIIWKPPKDSPVPLEGYEVSYTEAYADIPSDWRKADVPEKNSKKRKRRVKFRKLEPNTMYIFTIKAYGQGLFGEEVRLNRTTSISIQ